MHTTPIFDLSSNLLKTAFKATKFGRPLHERRLKAENETPNVSRYHLQNINDLDNVTI